MSSFLKWIVWTIWYFPQPRARELSELIKRAIRTIPPWRIGAPHLFHNEEGRQWEIYFGGEESYATTEIMRIDVMRCQGTGRIVGLKMPDYKLAQSSGELLEEAQRCWLPKGSLEVQEARRMNACRICGGPVSSPFTLSYGEEFAHTKCLAE